MKTIIKRISLLFIFFFQSPLSYAQMDSISSEYWQCKAMDKTQQEWIAQSFYRITAINQAIELCKRESAFPATCRFSKDHCQGYLEGKTSKPKWQCTALDFSGAPWVSAVHSNKDNAALAAKAFCHHYSNQPDTCYINLITCVNPKNNLINTME